MDSVLRGHAVETIGRRMERDLEARLPLPAGPMACDKRASRVRKLSLVRSRPMTTRRRWPLDTGVLSSTSTEVLDQPGAEVIARHPRSYER